MKSDFSGAGLSVINVLSGKSVIVTAKQASLDRARLHISGIIIPYHDIVDPKPPNILYGPNVIN